MNICFFLDIYTSILFTWYMHQCVSNINYAPSHFMHFICIHSCIIKNMLWCTYNKKYASLIFYVILTGAYIKQCMHWCTDITIYTLMHWKYWLHTKKYYCTICITAYIIKHMYKYKLYIVQHRKRKTSTTNSGYIEFFSYVEYPL